MTSQEALEIQGTALEKGDIVLIRTGQMKYFSEADRYKNNAPGVSMGAAEFLVTSGAMVLGADNLTFEMYPSEVEGNPVPVHTYLLAQHGIPILELVYLEELAKDKGLFFRVHRRTDKIPGRQWRTYPADSITDGMMKSGLVLPEFR